MPDAPHIEIRAVRPDDLAGLVALANLPGVRRGTLRLPFTGEAAVRSRFIDSSGVHNIVAVLDSRVVGQASLIPHHGRMAHVAEIFVAVHDDFTRRGIGRRLVAALLDLADDWLGLVRIHLTVMVDNAPAIRLYESLGFVREGTERAAVLREGRYVDCHAMARLRPPPALG
jgi:putative acetyltransferase